MIEVNQHTICAIGDFVNHIICDFEEKLETAPAEISQEYIEALRQFAEAVGNDVEDIKHLLSANFPL